ncbi:MAG: protein kinase, partial [Gemmatimonadetes bacterium]|nr:protein kinase [Gemmatimonadota bacterium]
ATVYLAEDLKHQRKVAIKVLHPELAATLGPERFLREIKIAAQLSHPHILPLLDSGEAGGFLYYVMPYVDGQSLRRKLTREGELPIGEVVRILREVVDALAEAHARGVVHRDIKPDNVLIRGNHVVVTDFGVAKAVTEATGRQQLTTAGVALGTPAYMAPEQAAANPNIDHRADIYAVGVMGYEMLAGRPPFDESTPEAVLAAHVTQDPDPIASKREVAPLLADLIMRCLKKKPADRWQTATELLAQLEVIGPTGTTPTDTQPLKVAAPSPASRIPPYLGVALAAAVVIAAGAWLWFQHRAPSTLTMALLPIKTIAVDSGDAFFSEGLTRETITALTSAGVHIKGYASVSRYVTRELPLSQIAGELGGVNVIAVGTMNHSGDQLRLDVELLDPKTGENRWAANYTVSSAEAAGLPNRIARGLANAVGTSLSTDQADRVSTTTLVKRDALDEYFLGTHFVYRWTPADFRVAVSHLRRAIELDSSFAPPYALLGFGYTWAVGYYGWVPAAEGYPISEAAARRALQLDGRSGLATLSLGLLHFNRDWKWELAISELRHAVDLEPSAGAYNGLAWALVFTGRIDEGLPFGERSVDVDPTSAYAHTDLGGMYVNARRYDDALRQTSIALALDSNYAEAHLVEVWAYSLQRRVDDAIRELVVYDARSGDAQPVFRPWIYALAGQRARAQAALDSLEARVERGESLGMLGIAYAALGETDKALDRLDAAIARHEFPFPYLPMWDPVRQHPRFHAAMQRMGLSR